uniref:hypothetical protein n=1 Tax=uncultured Dysgonomonas sp. TaxID=206096 RepID=UPI00258BFB4F|nr:hypothetical protein [uncultured Dysgonomonas sp.]
MSTIRATMKFMVAKKLQNITAKQAGCQTIPTNNPYNSPEKKVMGKIHRAYTKPFFI